VVLRPGQVERNEHAGVQSYGFPPGWTPELDANELFRTAMATEK